MNTELQKAHENEDEFEQGYQAGRDDANDDIKCQFRTVSRQDRTLIDCYGNRVPANLAFYAKGYIEGYIAATDDKS